ncbi:MAG: response regulator transcription factor [Propionibacteriaceae bacterium]|jgi:DNA-binding response OmpR family regulator|nr:response regulator transcription factor [Propionibacteriaceae bacterium]
MPRILIVEDEPKIASFLVKGLRARGFTTDVSKDGQDALDLAMHGDYDLMLLDIGLPILNGYEVLTRIRGRGSTLPVIILTARDSSADKVQGLEGGADDYLAKPFDFDELLARIRLRLRTPQQSMPASRLTHGGLSVDETSRDVIVDGRSVELSAREFTLLLAFMRRPRHVLTREQLLSEVWGYDYDPSSNVVDVYVRYLRTKLGNEWIETVRGVGYRLKRQPTAAKRLAEAEV